MGMALAIVAFVLILDQITKFLVVYHMELGQSIEIIPNFLYLTSHRNAGAAWGILYGEMIFFYVVTVVVVTVLFIWLRRLGPKDKLLRISLALLLGGALGNFIDRVLFQTVVDMVDTFIFGYNFPIFNVADMALTFGVVLMGIDAILESRQKKA